MAQKKYPKSPFPKRELPLLVQSHSHSHNHSEIEPHDDIEHSYTTSLSSSQSLQHTFNSSYSGIQLTHSHTTESISQSNQHHKNTSSIRNFIHRQLSKSGSDTQLTKSKIKPIPKSKWHPTIQFILNDDQLLTALLIFMTKQYNEENILFLQSVSELKTSIDYLISLSHKHKGDTIQKDAIDFEISDIYNTYIGYNAEKQINLSSECLNNMIYMYSNNKFRSLSLFHKHQIFDKCVLEITNLITNSILESFYTSEEFQVIAYSRNILNNQKHDSNFNDLHNAKFFDSHCKQHCNDKNKYIVASKGYLHGIHQWNIHILQCDNLRQEFGVISHFDTSIIVNEFGLCNTPLFGARSVYGYNHLQQVFYYASYNKDNSVRCEKDVSNLAVHKHYHWRKNDVIKIWINCKKGKIKYYLNGKQVRKTISLERDTTYYPIIVYSGHCVYKVVDEHK